MKSFVIEVALTMSAFMVGILTFFRSAVMILLEAFSHGAISVNVNKILLYSLGRSLLPGLIVGILLTAYCLTTSNRSEKNNGDRE